MTSTSNYVGGLIIISVVKDLQASHTMSAVVAYIVSKNIYEAKKMMWDCSG